MEYDIEHQAKNIVAAVDFGTTSSGYAYCYKYEYIADPSKIHTPRFTSDFDLTSKTPTCVLLDPNESFHSFGYEAEVKYTELKEEKQNQHWYFFREFKIQLYKNKVTKGDIMLVDETGKKFMSAKKIFMHGIRYIKGHLRESLETKDSSFDQNDAEKCVYWVFTVPGVFSEAVKQIITEAACEAGIEKSSMNVIFEPEAAAECFCSTLRTDKLSFVVKKEPGKKFIVLDIGGVTTDIALLEYQKNGRIRVLQSEYKTGTQWGGKSVDENLLTRLVELFSNAVFQKFKIENDEDYLDILYQFREKKRYVREKGGRFTVRIPTTLLECFEKETGGKFSIDKSERNVSLYSDKLQIDVVEMKRYFADAVENIASIKNMLPQNVWGGIDTVLVVGGFSQSEIVQEILKTQFPDKTVLFPIEPELAVVKGAVYFGHKQIALDSSSESANTGSSIAEEFKENFDQMGKKDLIRQNKELLNRLKTLEGRTKEVERLYAEAKRELQILIPRYQTLKSEKDEAMAQLQKYAGKEQKIQEAEKTTDVQYSDKAYKHFEDLFKQMKISFHLGPKQAEEAGASFTACVSSEVINFMPEGKRTDTSHNMQRKDEGERDSDDVSVLKKKVRRCSKYIIKNSRLVDLLDGFFSEEIFDQSDVECVKSQKSADESNREFLYKMFNKKDDAIWLFLEELQDSGRGDIVKLIKETKVQI